MEVGAEQDEPDEVQLAVAVDGTVTASVGPTTEYSDCGRMIAPIAWDPQYRVPEVPDVRSIWYSM